MGRTLSLTLLAVVMVITAAPATVNAMPTAQDSSVVGHGTWFLGTAQLTCDRDIRPTGQLEFVDQCTYRADSAPSETQSDDGCIEFANETIVAGCRAVLNGATKTTSRIPDVCTQGGVLDGNPGHPLGPPDGEVTVHSSALNKSYAVPVTIALNGSFATITGSRRVDDGPIGQIVVEGHFLWNLEGQQSCPIQGSDPTTGVWQGTYTFFRNTAG